MRCAELLCLNFVRAGLTSIVLLTYIRYRFKSGYTHQSLCCNFSAAHAGKLDSRMHRGDMYREGSEHEDEKADKYSPLSNEPGRALCETLTSYGPQYADIYSFLRWIIQSCNVCKAMPCSEDSSGACPASPHKVSGCQVLSFPTKEISPAVRPISIHSHSAAFSWVNRVHLKALVFLQSASKGEHPRAKD